MASDPTISRLIDALASDPLPVIAAIRAARAAARARVWGQHRPVAEGGPVVIDLDATLVGAHSEKEGATANFKRGFGFHPMLAFVDHGQGGTGEPLVAMLRPGKATANDAADQIAVLNAALAQLPERLRSRLLVRGDTGCGGPWVCLARPQPGFAVLGWSVRPPTRAGGVGGAAHPGLAPGTGCRRPPTGGRPGRRADQVVAGHVFGLAARDAHHRPPGTPPSRRSIAPHRPRRLADHRVRHQYPAAGDWPTWRSATGCGHAPRTASAGSRTPG